MTAAPPRLIVEIRGGKSHGEKAVIAPGAALRFGRTDLSDVAVPHDSLLSSVHFELRWDGARCHLRDRNSIGGTTLNGLPVLRAEVPHGGWIHAGRTDFMVYVEGKTPPLEEDTDGDDRRAAAEKALKELRAEARSEPLYAIVDAARDDRILEILRESVEKHQSLYEGVDGEALEHVAPYLCGPLREDSMLLDRLVLEGWGKRWGIYVQSRAPFREVRRHFRRFLMVELEETREKTYLRFYDPYVLSALWPSLTPLQLAQWREHITSTFIAAVPTGQSTAFQPQSRASIPLTRM